MQKSKYNCVINAVYTEMSGKVENDSNNTFWLTKLKHMLEDNGFAEVWIYPGSVNVDLFIPVFLKEDYWITFLLK